MKQLLLILLLPFTCLAQSHNPAPYCLDHVSLYSAGTVITHVSFNTLSNSPYPTPVYVPQANSDSAWWGYNYYDTIPPTIVHTDSTYQLSVSFDYNGAPTYKPIYYSVWIDYNHNGYFDSTETIMTNRTLGTLPAAAASKQTYVTIPHGAYIGITRMRVMRREQFADFGSNYLLLACGSGTANSTGNIQDYDIQITDTLATVDTTAGVPSITQQQPTVYPNPSTGLFYIGNEKIDLSGYPAGLYIRRVGDKYYKLSKY